MIFSTYANIDAGLGIVRGSRIRQRFRFVGMIEDTAVLSTVSLQLTYTSDAVP